MSINSRSLLATTLHTLLFTAIYVRRSFLDRHLILVAFVAIVWRYMGGGKDLGISDIDYSQPANPSKHLLNLT